MVQFTSCPNKIQLSVFKNQKQQCALLQRLSKITGDFPFVSETISLLTSLQEKFPDKTLANLEKYSTKTLDIQQEVKEVLSTETEYDGVQVQPSPNPHREVSTFHINHQSKPKTNFKGMKMENWNDLLEEYRSQCLGADMLKLHIDSEEFLRNSLTFYKKCIDNSRQLLKRFKVQ